MLSAIGDGLIPAPMSARANVNPVIVTLRTLSAEVVKGWRARRTAPNQWIKAGLACYEALQAPLLWRDGDLVRHAFGFLLGVLLTPALAYGSAWGYVQAGAAYDALDQTFSDRTRMYGSFALLAAVGL